MRSLLHIFGTLDIQTVDGLAEIAAASDGMLVRRQRAARSSTPFPSSNDLESALIGMLAERGFVHHPRVIHPSSVLGFEYDFWRERDQVAMEVMG